MPNIFLPFAIEYAPTGWKGRPEIQGMKPLAPRIVQLRLDGDTVVITDPNGNELERWARDRHWCVFPAVCPQCGSEITPRTPTEVQRTDQLQLELSVHLCTLWRYPGCCPAFYAGDLIGPFCTRHLQHVRPLFTGLSAMMQNLPDLKQ